jgi:hypothetical protein
MNMTNEEIVSAQNEESNKDSDQVVEKQIIVFLGKSTSLNIKLMEYIKIENKNRFEIMTDLFDSINHEECVILYSELSKFLPKDAIY